MSNDELKIAMKKAFTVDFYNEDLDEDDNKDILKIKKHKLNRYKRKLKQRFINIKNYKNSFYSYYKNEDGFIKHDYMNKKFFKNLSNRIIRRLPIPECEFDCHYKYTEDNIPIYKTGSNFKKVYDYDWIKFW